jgi:hypothetical protein
VQFPIDGMELVQGAALKVAPRDQGRGLQILGVDRGAGIPYIFGAPVQVGVTQAPKTPRQIGNANSWIGICSATHFLDT